MLNRSKVKPPNRFGKLFWCKLWHVSLHNLFRLTRSTIDIMTLQKRPKSFF